MEWLGWSVPVPRSVFVNIKSGNIGNLDFIDSVQQV